MTHMKNFVYALITLLALGALAISQKGPATPRALAADTAAPSTGAVSSVTGDLVIDFLGAQRGYVEPCG
jgi:hypothetical protein